MRSIFVCSLVVPQSHVALLYENGAYKRQLRAGQHWELKWLWTWLFVKRTYRLVDKRQRSITLAAQNIPTADKVLKVELLAQFEVTEPVNALHKVAAYEERIGEDVQLAARQVLASLHLETIRSEWKETWDAVRAEAQKATGQYGVEVLRTNVHSLRVSGGSRGS